MSETTNTDPLSALLRRLHFSARVFQRADFCGAWAVDSSGQHRIPFHLVTRGTGWLHLPHRAPSQMRAGQLVLFPQDGPHQLSSSREPPDPALINASPPTRIVEPSTRLVCGYFAFDQRAARPLLCGLPPVMRLELYQHQRSTPTSALVQLWMDEAGSKALGSDAAIDQLAQVVFIHMLRLEATKGNLQGVMAALADPKLGSLLAAIHSAPGAGHTVEGLAAQAGMSSSAFSQRFNRLVGMTPGRYVRHWRMNDAARALRESDRSLADIAATLGYESEAAFRKAFSAFFGQPPGAMRRQAR